MKKLDPESRSALLLMSAFVALGPLSTDMYLPALPSMVAYFDTSLAAVQFTLSAYLIGFAVFHLACGPLADRFGRKPILLGGIALFTFACVACALAKTVEQLALFRFIQGIGACTGPTLARAMVRDIYGPTRAAKALGYMAAIMALAPVVAPVIGGWMLGWTQWPMIFWSLGAYGLLGFVAVSLLLPESLPFKNSLRLGSILKNYARLLSHRHFMTSVFGISALYSGAFAFISGSSFVLIDFMGVSPGAFGLWFMVIVVGYIGGSLFTARVGYSLAPMRVMVGGAGLGLASAIVMAAFSYMNIHHPLAVVIPMMFYTAAVGITMPQAMSVALAPFPEMSATASALLGFLQMGAASLAGVVVGLHLDGSALPMALAIAAAGGLSLLGFVALMKSEPVCYDGV